nr:hypothetical protein L203_02604 [Cryptococcus depauperatus CBS 7841]
MDQDAFRSLLSAPRSAGSSLSRNVLGAPPPKRGWGLQAKERHVSLLTDYLCHEKKDDHSKAKSKSDVPAFAPRQHLKKEAKESQYKDRAVMRRQGAQDEYKSVEKLLEDFEARKANATTEELVDIEKQRAYLGGDAEHSVLVKGLDYALLAARKAELAKEEGENVDEELEFLRKDLDENKTKKVKVKGQDPVEENLGKGFKSIAQKKIEEEVAAAEKKKKKKKKKKEKTSNRADSSTKTQHAPQQNLVDESHKGLTAIPPDPVDQPSAPPAVESEDEDIFGDAGEYDLKAAVGGVSGEDEDEDEDMSEDELGAFSRKRSRSRSRSRNRSWSREPSPSRMNRYGDDLGSRSPGYRHQRSLSRSSLRDDHTRRRSKEYGSRYSRSPSHRGYKHKRHRPRSYSRSPSPAPDHNRIPRHHRTSYHSPSPRRRERTTQTNSPPQRRRRSSYTWHNRYSPSRRSISKSPSRPPRDRSRTRSLSPLSYDPYANLSPIRSPSPSADESTAFMSRLQPLSSSTIPSLKTFLATDEVEAKAAEKRARKAKWRVRQGLTAQEGVEMDHETAKKGANMNEKQKANREYQILMNQMNKKKKG